MPVVRAVFFNQISAAHSVLFHFLMTVQPVSLNELTRMLPVTQDTRKNVLLTLIRQILILQYLVKSQSLRKYHV